MSRRLYGAGVLVRVVGTPSGQVTPHDGRFVVSWNPHTEFGVAELVTSDDHNAARVFADAAEVLGEYSTTSSVEPRRPTDGEPNRPLTAFTIEIGRAE